VILDAHGVRLELPKGWSGRLFARDGLACAHVGDYPIELGDESTFGDASTGRMKPGDSFIALVEYRPGTGLRAGAGLFEPRRPKLPLDPTSFGPRRLAHPRPGQVGTQQFFTASERPFCIYVVLAGDRGTRRRQLTGVGHLLRSLQIAPLRVEHFSP
jgi:hypothetical protein